MLSLALATLLAASEPEAPAAPSVPVAELPEATALAPEAAPLPPLPPPGLLPDRAPDARASAPAASAAAPAALPKAALAAPAAPRRDRAKHVSRGGSPPKVAAKTPAASARTAPETPGVAPTPEELESPVVPPSLTSKAFLDEMRVSAREQKAQKQRRDDDRARLESLAKEIAEARASLRQETERLEAAAKKPQPGAFGSPEAKAKSYLALAKTVKGMRPEKAAELVSNLDRPLAVELLRRIRPSDAAAILEKLKAETAADLVARMASAGAEAP